MKKLLIPLLFLLLIPSVFGAENNKFGIHLAVPAVEQIEKASELVNSNGGDWGYITLVMQEDDRNHEKWQQIFDKLRELHLIPIIRIATKPVGATWRKPSADEAAQWADFLDGLQWVVKDRYVILFNETNHGSEWGGSVDAVDYANVTKSFAEKLKTKNPDFYVMLGGFDASAPQATPEYADEYQYFKTVLDTMTVSTFNSLFSGLSSHSYPNPGFVGSPIGYGRGSVRTYDWELNFLENLGVKKLPVFITETGWEGNAMSRDTIANNFQTAFNEIWLPDENVRAVTPFVLDYQGAPFLGFSWKQFSNDQYYQQFNSVQSMAKKAGEPEIHENGTITSDLPTDFVVNSNYHFKVHIKNAGQAIWDEKYGYKLALENFDSGYFFSDINTIRPDQSEDIDVFFKTGRNPGTNHLKIALYRKEKKILESSNLTFNVVPLPKLDFKVSLFPRLKHKGDDFEIQIFDEKEQLVFKKKDVVVEHTKGTAGEIRNIALNKKYRIVILKPYYLPRQTFVMFKKEKNEAVFEKMYPLDFSRDGKFDISDIGALILKPSLLLLLLP